MCKATRNHKIVEHLRQRFKERHGVELTKNRRMMLLSQIHKNVASLTARIHEKAELWKVELYNQDTYCNQAYTVIYDRTIDQITTVLPPTDSEEFAEFCETVNIPKERLLNQRLTARERTEDSVNKVIKMRRQEAVVKEGLKRLSNYKAINDYVQQKNCGMAQVMT